MAVEGLAVKIGVAVDARTGCPLGEVGWWGPGHTCDSSQTMNVCGSVRRGNKRDNNNTRAERRCGKPDWRTHEEFSTPTKVVGMTRGESPQRVAVVTGASSGIGEATARTLAGLGFHVVCVARREDRIRALADEIGGTATVADVTAPEAVDALAASLGRVDVLINNAGGAKGTEPVADADLEHWRWMWETNVLGTLRVTRALLPKLVDSGDGLIVTVTSIAAFEIYDGGGGYTSAKHAQGALHRTLRGELLGKPVRLTEIAPGMVETEFSVVRFGGDQSRADAVYQGMTPLVADDIAEVIGFVASRPPHVNLDQIVIRPRDQASATRKATRDVVTRP